MAGLLEEFVLSFLSLGFSSLGVVLAVSFFTLAERKIMASSQRRYGPDFVGLIGLLQPIADGLKLIVKENTRPVRSLFFLFFFFAALPFVVSLAGWVTVPISLASEAVDSSISVILFMALSTFSVYGTIYSGWLGNSKYSLLGGLRAVSQLISYELIMSFTFLVVICFSRSANFSSIVLAQSDLYFVFPLWPVAFLFYVAILAETNRTPFDLAEAEAELVSGYNTEFAALLFAFFFLAEYSSMLLLCAVFVLLFLGGWLPILFFGFVFPGFFVFSAKVIGLMVSLILVRAALPRFRYDFLMLICWRYLLPVTFGLVFFYTSSAFVFQL